MREEKTNVLRRLGSQEISAEEAARLLEQLDHPKEVNLSETKNVELKSTKSSKMFRIKVLSSDGDKVNIQIPLSFARIALQRGSGFLDMNIQPGLDIDVETLLEMIEEGNIGKLIDIESADGDTVEISID